MKMSRQELLKELDAELTRAHSLALKIVAHAKQKAMKKAA